MPNKHDIGWRQAGEFTEITIDDVIGFLALIGVAVFFFEWLAEKV